VGLAAGRLPSVCPQFTAPPLDRLALAQQYLALVAEHPVPIRMVRGAGPVGAASRRVQLRQAERQPGRAEREGCGSEREAEGGLMAR
jgi:hypothetical protein